MIMGDGLLGQMMEPVSFPDRSEVKLPEKPWATTGYKGDRQRNIIHSLELMPERLEAHNRKLQEKYADIMATQKRSEEYFDRRCRHSFGCFRHSGSHLPERY